MKTLKGFVRQRARPEGSMAEGWLVQESMVYITEFLAHTNPSVPRLWDNKDDERVVGELPQGKGSIRRMSEPFRNKVNKFCILNSEEMQKWISRYEEAKARRTTARADFRREHRRQPYPHDLALLPKDMTLDWLCDALRQATLNNEEVTEREWEFARGCDFHVSHVKHSIINLFPQNCFIVRNILGNIVWNRGFIIFLTSFVHLVQYKKYNALWSHGRHFRTEHIDKNRNTYDCGVMANFTQESRSSTADTNLLFSQLDYCGTINDILEVGFRQFSFFIFDVKWFKVVCNGPNATVRKDESGYFAIDSTRLWTDQSDTFVFPQQCEQVHMYSSVRCFFYVNGLRINIHKMKIVCTSPRQL